MHSSGRVQRSAHHYARTLLRNYAKGKDVTKEGVKVEGTPKNVPVGGANPTSYQEPPKTKSGSSFGLGLVAVAAAAGGAYAYNQVQNGEPIIPAGLELPGGIELPAFELPASLASISELFSTPAAPAPVAKDTSAPSATPAPAPATPPPAAITAAPGLPSQSPPAVPATPPPVTPRKEAKPPQYAVAPSEGELIRRAVEGGVMEGEEDNAIVFQAVQKMAKSDAKIFDTLLSKAKNQHKAEVEALQSALTSADQETQTLASQHQTKVAEMEAAGAEALATAEAQAEAALQAQKAALLAEAAAEAERERRDRLSLLDSLREKVNALGLALSSKGWEQERHHAAHTLSVSTFALEAALASGAPFTSQLAALLAAHPQDPLLHALAHAMPTHLPEKGAPTLTQVFDGFEEVKSVVRSQALLPATAGGSGPLSSGVSHIAGWLRLEEQAEVPVLGGKEVDGVEAVLAKTRKLLKQGDLMQAASVLDAAAANTAYVQHVQEWVSGVRDRVMVEQTIKVLQAHATAINASVS